jgi:anti-anti-sigma regulatory factor
MTTRRRAAARPKRGARPQRGRVLALAPDLTVADAAALKVRLSRLLGVPGQVSVDAGETRRIDTACFQLLFAFVRDRQAAGKSVAWSATNPEFTSTARTLGLAGALGLA